MHVLFYAAATDYSISFQFTRVWYRRFQWADQNLHYTQQILRHSHYDRANKKIKRVPASSDKTELI